VDAQLQVLVLYDDRSTYTETVREHVESFARFSAHRVWYAVATHEGVPTVSLDLFDVVVIHYSVRLSLTWQINSEYVAALEAFGGLTALFIQDEYETTETARGWIEKLGVDVIFTCVPDEHRDAVYPSSRFPTVRFENNLTGYVPAKLERLTTAKPLAEREIVIGYRGRPLPYWYGDLGQEKLQIGVRMRQICAERGIPADIEWAEEKRIYGPHWYDWLQSCRATLGTESGSNVFDERGEIRATIEAELERRPSLTYEEAAERFLAPHEGKIRMNQVSPRVFEAIALRTALILFEGEYSDVVRPDDHYLPLAKDFSNVDEVLDKVRDDALVERMTERAYEDIIRSGEWGYGSFVARVDRVLEECAEPRSDRRPPVSVLLGSQDDATGSVRLELAQTECFAGNLVTSAVLAPQDLWIPVAVGSKEQIQRLPLRHRLIFVKQRFKERFAGRPWILGTGKIAFRLAWGVVRVLGRAWRAVRGVARRVLARDDSTNATES